MGLKMEYPWDFTEYTFWPKDGNVAMLNSKWVFYWLAPPSQTGHCLPLQHSSFQTSTEICHPHRVQLHWSVRITLESITKVPAEKLITQRSNEKTKFGVIGWGNWATWHWMHFPPVCAAYCSTVQLVLVTKFIVYNFQVHVFFKIRI